jgi:IS30 family transposase
MGTKYDQLSLEERCEVARLHGTGCSIRQIAAALDRSASSISRELKRNRGQQIGYKPVYAQECAQARRWKGSKLERNTILREEVLTCLRKGWSPEQACGWIERQHGCKLISPETIYRFIHDQIARHKDYSWLTICRAAKASAAGAGAKAVVPPFISGIASPLPSVRRLFRIGPSPAIGRPI